MHAYSMHMHGLVVHIISVRTGTYRYVLICAGMYRYVPVRTMVVVCTYRYVPVRTNYHHGTYWYVPVRTSTYKLYACICIYVHAHAWMCMHMCMHVHAYSLYVLYVPVRGTYHGGSLYVPVRTGTYKLPPRYRYVPVRTICMLPCHAWMCMHMCMHVHAYSLYVLVRTGTYRYVQTTTMHARYVLVRTGTYQYVHNVRIGTYRYVHVRKKRWRVMWRYVPMYVSVRTLQCCLMHMHNISMHICILNPCICIENLCAYF